MVAPTDMLLVFLDEEDMANGVLETWVVTPQDLGEAIMAMVDLLDGALVAEDYHIVSRMRSLNRTLRSRLEFLLAEGKASRSQETRVRLSGPVSRVCFLAS